MIWSLLILLPASSLINPLTSMFQLSRNAPSSKHNCAHFLFPFVHAPASACRSSHTTLSSTNSHLLLCSHVTHFRSLLQYTPKLKRLVACFFSQYYLSITYFSINQLALCYNRLSACLVISPPDSYNILGTLISYLPA